MMQAAAARYHVLWRKSLRDTTARACLQCYVTPRVSLQPSPWDHLPEQVLTV